MISRTQRRREQLREEIRALTVLPLMRGSIIERMRKCGRPTCACAKNPKARHPGSYLSVTLNGRTQVRHLRREEQEPIRQAIETYRKLWAAIEGLTVCELAELRDRGIAKEAKSGKGDHS